MASLRGVGRRFAWISASLAVAVASLVAAPRPAQAIEHEVRLLLDLDDDAATGCRVDTVDGPFDGVEQILISTVETASPPPAGTVTDVALRDCVDEAADTFGPPSSFAGGWPIGIDNGTGGLDVVETYAPLASLALGVLGPMRLGVVVTDELGGEQALLTVDDTREGDPIVIDLRAAIEIPTLGGWAMLLLCVLISGAAVRLLGARGAAALLVVILVAAGTVAWAAGSLDGLIDDWSPGDLLGSDGIVLFGRRAAGDLCLRVDVELLFNSAPTADPQSLTTPEETPLAITLTGSDPESDPLTFTLVLASGPSNGGLTGTPPNLTYSPDLNFAGTDSFDFQVEDLSGATGVATVTIEVTPINDPPVVNGASFSIAEDQPPGAVVGTVTFTDPDAGQSHTFAITAGNTGGAFSIGAASGQITVAASLDHETLSSYSLTVEVTDDGAPVLSGSATVTVNVTDADDPPTAVADAATVGEDSGATAIAVLVNDTDIDGGPISVASVIQPSDGTVVITGGGAGLTYAPNADYCNNPPGTNPDAFTYTLAPGGSTATVSVTVTCVDDPPAAVADAATVTEDSGANAVDVLANDTDVDGGPISVASVTQPLNGTAGITGGDTGLTYAPNADYCNNPPGTGPDTFTYTLSPGGSSTTVSVTVTCVNDPPVAGADAFDFVGNTELRVDLAAATTPHALETTSSGFGVLDNDADPADNDPIFVSAIVGCSDVTAPFDCDLAGVGTVSMQATGRFSFVPEPGDTDASESFTYTLSDGSLSVNATVTLSRSLRVWYVDNDTGTAGVDGTSVDPFDTLAEAEAASSANDYLFVRFGDGTTAGQNAGIALKTGQHLLGEHVGLSLPIGLNGNGAPTVLFAAVPGNRPVLGDGTVGGPDGVSAIDAIPAQVAGFSLSGLVNAIEWATASGFAGTGAFEIRDNVITGAGAIGVDVDLAGTGATSLSFHDNSLTAAGAALDVQETGTGTLTITAFDDNVVSGNTGGSGMVINNAIFDAVPGGGFDLVSGGTTAVGASGNGVSVSGVLLTGVVGDLLFTDLDVFADAGTGLLVAGGGPANPGAGTGMRFRVGAGVGIVAATGGPAVDLQNLTADLQLVTATSSATTGRGVNLDGVTDGGGTNAVFTAGAGSSITTASGTGPAFRVNGGNARIAWAGAITNNAAGARAVSITGWAGDDPTDDLVLSGAIDENGAGILVNGNAGARAITFSGGLDIDTTTGEGFTATGNTNTLGINVTGSANDIDSLSAAALRVANTTIGSSNLNFRRVASGNNTAAADPVNGIVLSSTGSGRLIVTGTGGAGTGGTIQNTTGDGISLAGTTSPSFSFMNLTETGGHGISGTAVVGLTLVSANIQGAGDANDEDALHFATAAANNLSGTVLIQNSIVNAPQENGLYVQNHSGTLNLTVDNTDFTNSVLENGVLLIADGSATLTARVYNGSLFGGHESDGLAGLAQNTGGARLNLTVQGNTFTGDGTSDNALSIRSAQTASLRFNVDGNTITGHPNTAILLTSEDASNNQGILTNNTIGVSGGASGSGSVVGNGISWFGDDDSRGVVAITNNTISHTDLEGILALTNDATAQAANLDITITGNSVGTPDDDNFPTGFNGIFVRALNQSNVCADIQSNTAPAGSGSSPFDAGLQAQQRNTATFRLERLNGGGGTVATAGTVAAHLASENPGATTSAQVATSFTGVPNGTCATPEATPLP